MVLEPTIYVFFEKYISSHNLDALLSQSYEVLVPGQVNLNF